ncbi:hypothetical protein SD37_21865 [Amycolatopsis orientalis]|uniref:Uncharacterized protein n=1 Tax=Amycolatopsis orientalis TaxID=31958 RepID=A0A193C0T8_AMYOR|nr:hypothetical protein [Amycolatopsis orientalis]ANN18034.1 hypothetical protein SD37_21865 [Amycolatopsis orientalis]
MTNKAADTITLLFTGLGIDTAKAGSEIELVIDRFDNWTDKARVDAFRCFTGACCVVPPLAEAR